MFTHNSARFTCYLSLSLKCCMPFSLYALRLNLQNNKLRAVQLWTSAKCSFLHPRFTSCSLRINILIFLRSHILSPSLNIQYSLVLITKQVKVKWSHYRPGVAQRVGRGIALLFHDRGTRRGWVVSSTPWSHFTPGKDPVTILEEAGWAPGPVWTGAENLVSSGIRSDRPARSSVAIPTELPDPQSLVLIRAKNKNKNSFCVSNLHICRWQTGKHKILDWY